MEYYCEHLPNVKRIALRCAAWGDVFTRVHFVDAHFVRLPTCSNKKLPTVYAPGGEVITKFVRDGTEAQFGQVYKDIHGAPSLRQLIFVELISPRSYESQHFI